jgi:hypothetical protein
VLFTKLQFSDGLLGPKATGEEPEDSINCCKSRPWILSLQHSQLLPQYQILDEKVLAGTKGAH